MTNREELGQLIKEYEAMPEQRLVAILRTLDSSYYVYQKNYAQLVKLLGLYEDIKTTLELWSVENRPAQNLFHLEVTRLLHNFVASVKSLVEHTRRLQRELHGSDNNFPEYQQEVDLRFTKNELVQFIEDLRDYCLHYRQLPIFSQMNFTAQPQNFKSAVRLNLKTLSSYRKWSTLGRVYLKSQQRDLNVREVIDAYNSIVVNFHSWFRARLRQIHAMELDNLEQKRKGIASIVIPEWIQIDLPKAKGDKPDEAFIQLLTRKQLTELSKVPLSSPDHVEKLIEMLEFLAPLPQDLKQRIKDSYRALM
jgi:hypothetical protein